MHHVFVSVWRVSTYFVLSNAPRLLDWPKSVSVLANAPRLCVRLQGPIWYVLSNAPHLFGVGGPNLFYVLANAPRLLCLPGGSHLVLCSPMHLVFWTGPNLFS